jgi:hypothetical protein
MSVAAITPVPEPELLKLSALSAHSAAPPDAHSGASCRALPEAQAPHWARQPKAKVATSRLTCRHQHDRQLKESAEKYRIVSSN